MSTFTHPTCYFCQADAPFLCDGILAVYRPIHGGKEEVITCDRPLCFFDIKSRIRVHLCIRGKRNRKPGDTLHTIDYCQTCVEEGRHSLAAERPVVRYADEVTALRYLRTAREGDGLQTDLLGDRRA